MHYKFLKEIEDGGKTSKDDLLISASESKEYLSDFFENFISQFCKHTFGIEQGTSHTEYSIKLKDNSTEKREMARLKTKIRKILDGTYVYRRGL